MHHVYSLITRSAKTMAKKANQSRNHMMSKTVECQWINLSHFSCIYLCDMERKNNFGLLVNTIERYLFTRC